MKTWISAYLFYAGNWEGFLKDSIKPFVDFAMQQKLIDQYFFIRYVKNGPHVRLRLKGDTELLNSKVKPALEHCIKAYFKKNPSKREDPEWVKQLPESDRWYENNSILYFEYKPETILLGGPFAMKIAEKQFHASSQVVLKLFSQTNIWSYQRALGAAIQVHLGFSYAMGMSFEEMKHFYSYVFANWLPKAYGFNSKDTTEANQIKQNLLLKRFEELFLQQQDGMLSIFQTFQQISKAKAEFEEEWMNTWIRSNKIIQKELIKLNQNHQIQLNFQKGKNILIPEERQRYWSIFDNYIHLTNNRLGIVLQDEAYLSFMIVKSINNLI